MKKNGVEKGTTAGEISFFPPNYLFGVKFIIAKLRVRI